ncbi:MAG TPA: PepSY domain-containing protein [Candidatus Dwaynia gallinarum]|nr:PepSY domain-containing protein [Candidatus Dwaynia gallinarum]
MKNSRIRIAACIFSVALLFGIFNTQGSSDTSLVVGATQTVTVEQQNELSLEQLKQKALQIVPGNIIKTKYDYDMMVGRIVEFKIIDKNGIQREVELVASNGKVWDIDYDYDEQGNRFINKGLFTVKFSFEQAQEIASTRVPGKVLAHKQDVERGKFVYEFMIQANMGGIFEVDVETETGTVIKVEREDDFDFYDYALRPVFFSTPEVVGTTITDHNSGTVAEVNTSVTEAQVSETYVPPAPIPNYGTGQKSEAELRQIVLGQVPGTVLHFYQDWDDGMIEYKYIIKTNSGAIFEVEILANGYITDIDYEDDYYYWD